MANVISDHWSTTTLLEGQIEVDNPFFTDAQQNPERWMFHSQLHFLAASARRHEELRRLLSGSESAIVLEDRTPFEHHGVYSQAAVKAGYLQPREMGLLTEVAQTYEQGYLNPDLLIYREMSTEQLLSRVTSRGRAGETVDFDRLQTILETFEEFISAWDRSDVVRVPADVDLLSPDGQDQLIAQLEGRLPRL
ncbi:hypothetical protein ASF79_15840 [Agreia sp. Leaf335]|nr:hypothetical protein ASF79_15840 [Agreia sp. Leaf335]